MAEAATVGNYVLERELGRGGMGAVYAGVHKLVGRRAAIKVLLPDLSRKQELVERFFNEARAAGKIKHPSIVDIYDFGYAHDGSAYIVMELLEGETLAARLKSRGPMPIPAAVALARQVANALGAAHAQGIVHRDLKPDNVFLVKDPEVAGGERVKLLDFGIAKLATDTVGVSATVTGAILGTPHYMSPEQCEGSRVVDARTDVYSLGCMLFQMLSGQLPFDSPGIGGLIGMHLHVQPPLLRTKCAAASVELEAVVARLLAKPLEERFQSAEAVANALGAPTVSAVIPIPTGAGVTAPLSTTGPTVATGSNPSRGADATELGNAHTMATPSSVPPTGSRVPTEIDRQARAETVPATPADILAGLRPPTLPVEDISATGKRPTVRGDDPTVPSLPPQMMSSQIKAEAAAAATTGRSKAGPRVIVIVSVLVVALGAVLLVQFNNKAADSGGNGRSDPYSGSGPGTAAGGLAGTGRGTGTDYVITPATPDAEPVIEPPPGDVKALEVVANRMGEAAGKGELETVTALHETLIEMSASCGEPCAEVRKRGDDIIAQARHDAYAAAEKSIARRVKNHDCDGAARDARNAIERIGPDAEKLEKQAKGCKPAAGGGIGSDTGNVPDPGAGDPIGSDTDTDPDSATVGEAFKAGKWAEAVELCKQRAGGRTANLRYRCALAACKAGPDYAGIFKKWLGRLRPKAAEAVRRTCGAGGETPEPPIEQTNAPNTPNAPNMQNTKRPKLKPSDQVQTGGDEPTPAPSPPAK